jgi:membrane protease YdiL (CAAX protease family)
LTAKRKSKKKAARLKSRSKSKAGPKLKATDRGKWSRYFSLSRTLAASYVFVVPILVGHQAGLMEYPDAGNGTTPIYAELFDKVNWVGAAVFNLVLLSLLCFAIYRTRDERKRLSSMYAWMFFEATVWAALLYVISVLIQPYLLAIDPSWDDVGRNLTVAIGAGIFEEFLFRFLLLGGIAALFIRGLRAPRKFAFAAAILMSACVFSFAHHAASHIGSEPWDLGVFSIRALLGALIGLLYCWRGLGIVVYTHALYNVAVLH